ncbi:hypothetical protein EYC84_004186 [Monilinia fructicola]|uniref:Uncharacterized protein n=1 Tax=Monilinia fructicola TaxID=38448 RepID=A0A5M9K470_MONFR|nr:hypothetical protein EYC84_004186 [Monilinia fructicola]
MQQLQKYPHAIVDFYHLCILDNNSVEALWVLDIDGLDVTVQLLLGTLLVVTLSRDSYAKSEWNTLDTSFPNLLVQLGVETNIGGTL